MQENVVVFKSYCLNWSPNRREFLIAKGNPIKEITIKRDGNNLAIGKVGEPRKLTTG